MKTTVLALGSRGDVQPAIALGKALAARGHAISVLAGKSFQPWIEAHGLAAIPASVDSVDIMESDLGKEWVSRGTNPMAQSRILQRIIDRFGAEMADDALRACEGAELILSSFTSDTYAASIAEASGAVQVSMPLQPSILATRHGPTALAAPVPRRDSVLNLLFGKLLIEPTVWRWYGGVTARVRQRLGLPPQDRRTYMAALRRMLVVHGYSAHVVPHPPDWPPSYHTTGYWFLDEGEEYRPPESLERFLAAGEPPIALGFGSMTSHDPGATTRLLVDAVARSGQRAILLSGWAGLGDIALPDTILRIDAAPHDWLYPRVAAAVIHGGAGTVAACLRAGRPAVVVPHLADQLFWGRRVEELRVGPRAIPRPRLTADALAAAIRTAATDAGMKQRAEELGRKIRGEDGVTAAIGHIERHLAARGRVTA
ncbi:glycosyltransferase [Sorangium sp. So ce117]|uniref:glycosyltransferase n=1 Tax=Sorangium sp. So ce117 TaxID=3133277 RepID=UPI003F616F9F